MGSATMPHQRLGCRASSARTRLKCTLLRYHMLRGGIHNSELRRGQVSESAIRTESVFRGVRPDGFRVPEREQR